MQNIISPLGGGQLRMNEPTREEDLFGEIRSMLGGMATADESRAIADEAWRLEREGKPRAASYLRSSIPKLRQWRGFTPRDWQAEALDKAKEALERGARGIIRATTGSGKSVVQAELVAHLVGKLERGERIVVSAPTQKLVAQLGATIEARCPGMVGRYYQYNKELHRPIIVVCHASMWDGQVVCPDCHGLEPSPTVIELEGDELARARSAFNEAAIGGDLRHCERSFHHKRAVSRCSRLAGALLEEALIVRFWVADECHKTECDQVLGFDQRVQPVQSIGFTATPWRASEDESLTLFEELLYDYGPARAIKDGVVIRPTIVSYEGEATSLDAACVEMIKAHLEVHPGSGVVSADSIADADRFARVLITEGIEARSIHSQLSQAEQADRIAALEEGTLDCLVHVCLLAEGVDLPWLTWLCMRRESVSRVRFVQEVGRVIRTFDGKSNAYVLDPNDFFGRLSLDYSAVLGGESDLDDGPQSELDALAKEVAALFAPETPTADPGTQEAMSRWRGSRRIRGLDLIRSWIRRTAVGYKLAGYAKLKVDSTAWRAHDATKSQVDLIGHLMRKRRVRGAADLMSDDTRQVLRNAAFATRDGELNRGDVSDLITILQVIEQHGELIDLDAIEEVAA